MTEISLLRRRMIDDVTVRNLSSAIQRSYIHAVAKYGRFFGRWPERFHLEVRTSRVHLVAGGISWPALSQAVCVLRFPYASMPRKSARPAAAGSHAALRRADVPGVEGSGRLSPSRRGARAQPRRPSQPGRTASHVGGRAVPHRRIRRPCRAVRRLLSTPVGISPKAPK